VRPARDEESPVALRAINATVTEPTLGLTSPTFRNSLSPRLNSYDAIALIACLLTGAAIGVVVPYLAGIANVPLVILLLCGTPIAVWLCRVRPVLALGLMVASQVLDSLQVQTPVASLSARTVLIVLLVVSQFPAFLERLRARAELRLTFIFLLAWLAIYPLRIVHTSADLVMREVVTNASFVAVAAIGAALSESKHVLRTVAAGSALALGVLGTSGVLVSLGYLQAPARVSLSRSFFGITSPFVRNYGLDVPFDAVALLIPLCVPFLALNVLGRKGSLRLRAGSLVVLLGITLAALLVFQARGMVIQIGLALLLSAWLTRNRLWFVIGVGASALLLPSTVNLIFLSDPISSGLRLGTAQAVLEQATNPASLLFGSNQDLLFATGAENAGFAAAISYAENANVIHNLFLQNLAAGGLFAFLFMSAAHVVLVYYAIRLWRVDRAVFESQVLLVAVALVLLELNLEPVRANIVGSWLVMGLCLGRQVRQTRKSPLNFSAAETEPQVWPQRGEAAFGGA
jgi:hypothetical protein